SVTVALVCDGMGGMVDGGAAAALAASTFIADLANSSGNLDDRLLRAVLSANFGVNQRFRGRGGTTLTAIVFDQMLNGCAVHVGDSRLYRRTQDEFHLMTTDDTVQGVVRASSDEGNEDDLDNQLIQFVGIGPEIEPHIIPLFMGGSVSRPLGTAWVLTTDGAHGFGRQMLHGISKSASSVGDLVRKLMFVADAASVGDNASTVALFPQELSILPTFHNGTTVAVWTPTDALEMWIEDRNEIDNRSAMPSVASVTPVKPMKVRITSKAKTKPSNKKRNPESQRYDAGGDYQPVAQEEAEVPTQPQLNITFGNNPSRND
ncbi:MAG: PP2C family protein-serine/threonine phosphatase, partial [bacterium]